MESETSDSPEPSSNESNEEGDENNQKITVSSSKRNRCAEDGTTRPVRPGTKVDAVVAWYDGRVVEAHDDMSLKMLGRDSRLRDMKTTRFYTRDLNKAEHTNPRRSKFKW